MLYLITLLFFKIYDRPSSKYVFPPSRFFFNFRKPTYPLWLDVIQNAWHCKVTAIDFHGKLVAFEESQNRTILYGRFMFFFLGGIQFQHMEQLCMLQVCSKPFDSSYMEIDLWVETLDVFLSALFTDAEALRGRSGSFTRMLISP
jgi:hypothetical protein